MRAFRRKALSALCAAGIRCCGEAQELLPVERNKIPTSSNLLAATSPREHSPLKDRDGHILRGLRWDEHVQTHTLDHQASAEHINMTVVQNRLAAENDTAVFRATVEERPGGELR